MRKRILCFSLGLAMLFTQVVPTEATTRKEQLQEQKQETQEQYYEEQAKIDSLEEKKAELAAEINALDADLVNILVEIDVLTGDIEAKEKEIESTRADLVVAEDERDQQYAAMKTRIQYLYENGGDSAWMQLILNAKSFADMLNQAEYIQQLYESDRTSLENFKATVQQVTDLGNQLGTEKADLEIMQMELQNQQANLEVQLEQKKATSSDYANQIAAAERQAEAYVALIREQTAEIQRIEEEERKAAEEAARRAAEEAARQEAARQEAARREEEARREAEANRAESNSSNNSSNSNGSSSSGSSSGGSTSSGSSSGSSSSGGSSSNVPYNPTGQSVVDYACQFVGNPYVWGGESLTNGADCSGFIKSVYAKFGVSLPHSSAAMRSCGRGVSYSQAMPGDIICYSGHVAIYMGGGAIVHASNERDGIKISPNAAYRTILAVRRIL